MNIIASFFGLGTPELAFLLGVAVVIALIFLVVKNFLKGYSRSRTKK